MSWVRRFFGPSPSEQIEAMRAKLGIEQRRGSGAAPTDTPRTDAFQQEQQQREIGHRGKRDDTVSLINLETLDFARQLEREVEDLRHDMERLMRALNAEVNK